MSFNHKAAYALYKNVKSCNDDPPIQEQLDDIYHNGIDGWKSTIKAIKDKYPKSGG